MGYVQRGDNLRRGRRSGVLNLLQITTSPYILVILLLLYKQRLSMLPAFYIKNNVCGQQFRKTKYESYDVLKQCQPVPYLTLSLFSGRLLYYLLARVAACMHVNAYKVCYLLLLLQHFATFMLSDQNAVG